MPRYNQKITRLMTYLEFKQGLSKEKDPLRRAFLAVLFFSGCRISEALALKDQFVVHRGSRTIWFHFHRLKGSKQTEPQEIPFIEPLHILESHMRGQVFPWSRMTGYRIVKRAFPELYPHFFRMNSITTALQQGATIPEIRADFGLSLNAMDHYIGNVGTKRLGELRRKLVTT